MPGTKIIYISGPARPRRPARRGVGQFVADNWQPPTPWNIAATSVPVLDGWGWGDYWQCPQWQQWHQLNKQAFGKAIADQKFIAAWQSQDSFSNPYNWCKYDSTFRNYFVAEGIDIDSIASAVVMPVYNVLATLLNGIDHTTTNAVDAVTSISKWIKPVAFVAAVAGGYWVYKNFLK
jgi:hypothetical protein